MAGRLPRLPARDPPLVTVMVMSTTPHHRSDHPGRSPVDGCRPREPARNPTGDLLPVSRRTPTLDPSSGGQGMPKSLVAGRLPRDLRRPFGTSRKDHPGSVAVDGCRPRLPARDPLLRGGHTPTSKRMRLSGTPTASSLVQASTPWRTSSTCCRARWNSSRQCTPTNRRHSREREGTSGRSRRGPPIATTLAKSSASSCSRT